jgi:hypothetical protein
MYEEYALKKKSGEATTPTAKQRKGIISYLEVNKLSFFASILVTTK